MTMEEGADRPKETDDVAGAASALDEEDAEQLPEPDPPPEPSAERDPLSPAPPEVEDLAGACVRFVAARYGVTLDFEADTLSFVDQWMRDARAEAERLPEAVELVHSAAGAYLGEVIRRAFGAEWLTRGPRTAWRLRMSTVYCSFNPLGMTLEAIRLEPEPEWSGHFELDPGEQELVDRRLAALPAVGDEEFYAPSTRFDVVSILVGILREEMRSHGTADVRFTAEDYT